MNILSWSKNVFLFVFFLSIFQSDPGVARSLDDVLSDVREKNPEIISANSLLLQTYEDMPVAWSNYSPNISITSSVERAVTDDKYDQSSTRSDTFSNTLSLSQDLLNMQHNEQFRQAKLKIEKQEATFRSVVQRVLLSTITAYLDVLKKHNIVLLHENNLKVLETHMQSVRTQHEMRRRTNADLAQAESRLAKGKADLLSAEIDINVASSAFTRITGSNPEFLTKPGQIDRVSISAEEIEKIALTDHPSVIIALLEVELAESQIKSKKRAFAPSLALSGSVAKSNSNNSATASSGSTVSSIGLTLSVPLFQKGMEYSDLRHSQEELKKALANLDNARRTVVDNVRNTWESRRGAYAKIEAYELQVRAAKIALESVKQELSAGRRSTLDVLNAEQELLNARVNLAGAEHDSILSEYRLIEGAGNLR